MLVSGVNPKTYAPNLFKILKGQIISFLPSASCTGFVRNNYGKLFENNAFQSPAKKVKQRMYELSEFLVQVLGITNLGASFPAKITYHDSCAGLRECKIKEEPRKLLNAVEGIEIVEMADVETCCGFWWKFCS